MKRDPALHVTRSALFLILNELGYEIDEKGMDKLYKLAKPHQLRGRTIVRAVGKSKKKIERVVAADTNSVETFNRILAALRQVVGHKGAQVIKSGDASYIMLKEVTTLAEDFCDAFELQRAGGFKQYIGIGLELMGRNYAINKFKYYNEKIAETHRALLIVKEDDDKEATEEFYNEWYTEMWERTGMEKKLTQIQYAHMVNARQKADECKAVYKDWIVAQFEGLAFVEAVPELTQLYEGKAQERYEKYAAEKNLKKKETKGDLPKGDTDAERTYYDRVG